MKNIDYFTIVCFVAKDFGELQDAAKYPSATIDLLASGDFSEQKGFYAADPFIFSHNGVTHVFCEILTTQNKGFIGKYRYDRQTGTLSSPCLVLEESFHLSYPQLIKHVDGIYMLPETGGAGDIRLYKAENDELNEWKYHSTLIRGIYYDPTPIFHHGTWFLFTSSGKDFSKMHIFTSDTLTDGWTEHPLSPFPLGPDSSRAAGPILVRDNKMYRLAQDCSVRYGQAVKAYEITNLSKYAYSEQFSQVLLREGDDGYNTSGMHHLQHVMSTKNGELFIADGYKRL